MNYIFFGTPEFAEIILRKLIDAGMPPMAVVCNPDRPVGRKKIVTPPPTKIVAEKYGIKAIQPEKLDENTKNQLANFKPDFFVVAAYAKIIPKDILEISRLGTMGVHPSLLPKYRGSSPIQTAILAGEQETGVTLYLLDKKMDHGPIMSRATYHVAQNDNYGSLLQKLAELGGDLLVKILPKFLAGETRPQPQNEAEATYTKKFATNDAFVGEDDLKEATDGTSPEKTAIIERKIRALNPEPGVWTTKNGKRVKLLESEIQNGKLVLKKIQEEGGRPKLL